MIKSEVIVPLLNANEPEARLVNIHVKDGQIVEKGDLLFTIETTKAAAEVEAPTAGFVRLATKEGDVLEVGKRLAVIADSADEPIPEKPVEEGTNGTNLPGGLADLRITRPARALAELLGLNFSTLPTGKLITEEMVRQLVQLTKAEIILPPSEKPYLVLFGAGGHAKTILEMVLQLGSYAVAGILDDNGALTGSRIFDVPVLGTRLLLPALAEQGVKLAANGVGGILDIGVRVKIFDTLDQAGYSFPVLVHPRATVEPSATIGEGVQIFANAYVGSEAVLEPKCMVNTSAVVSHDCVVGEYTHIAPGALLAGHVHVGSHVLMGMGVTTAIGVKIGVGARIGNGAILLADVPDKTIIQAGRFWTGKAG